MTHFLARRPGPDSEALQSAFRIAVVQAAEGGHPHITLAVPAKGNLQGLIEDLLGEKRTRSLALNNELSLRDVTLNLTTQRLPLRHEGPVLAAWTSWDQTESILQSRYPTDVIYLPWLDEEMEAFLARLPKAIRF